MNETPIEVVEYDPGWPERYEREAERVRDALGDRLLQIEHVGSTAVPGLAAKPIIDLCPVVSDRDTALDCVDPLEGIGYEFGYDFESDRIHLGRTATDGQKLNLHLPWRDTLAGLEENLLLCAYLRDHPPGQGAVHRHQTRSREKPPERRRGLHEGEGAVHRGDTRSRT